MDLAVLEAPAVQARITGPSRPTPLRFGSRAQPQRTESLRRASEAAAVRAASLPDPDPPDLAARRVLPIIEMVSQPGAVGQKLPASHPQLRG